MRFLSLLFLFCFLIPAGAANLPPEKPKMLDGVAVPNLGNDLWREVRQRDGLSPGISQVQQVDSGVLINYWGDRWARFRMQDLSFYSGIGLAGMFAFLMLFFLLRGKIPIDGGYSGDKLKRYTSYERVAHWTLAIVFLFLAITGLILLLGRPLLIPLFGKEAFGLIASASKEGHNLFGPLFLVSLVMMLVTFVRRNIYEKGDLTWLLRGGGIIGSGHASAGFFNMGEKTWYWMVILIGLVISVSGLILLTPFLGHARTMMELSHLVHTGGAVFLMAVSLGHMYIGSIGSEGALDGMSSGYVDVNWADSHHDRWGKECREQGLIVPADEYAARMGQQPRTEAQ